MLLLEFCGWLVILIVIFNIEMYKVVNSIFGIKIYIYMCCDIFWRRRNLNFNKWEELNYLCKEYEIF